MRLRARYPESERPPLNQSVGLHAGRFFEIMENQNTPERQLSQALDELVERNPGCEPGRHLQELVERFDDRVRPHAFRALKDKFPPVEAGQVRRWSGLRPTHPRAGLAFVVVTVNDPEALTIHPVRCQYLGYADHNDLSWCHWTEVFLDSVLVGES